MLRVRMLSCGYISLILSLSLVLPGVFQREDTECLCDCSFSDLSRIFLYCAPTMFINVSSTLRLRILVFYSGYLSTKTRGTVIRTVLPDISLVPLG